MLTITCNQCGESANLVRQLAEYVPDPTSGSENLILIKTLFLIDCPKCGTRTQDESTST